MKPYAQGEKINLAIFWFTSKRWLFSTMGTTATVCPQTHSKQNGSLELLHLIVRNIDHLVLLTADGHHLWHLGLRLLHTESVASLGHHAHSLLLRHERLLGVHRLLDTSKARLLNPAKHRLLCLGVRRLKLHRREVFSVIRAASMTLQYDFLKLICSSLLVTLPIRLQGIFDQTTIQPQENQ